jgi:hypothetical protein
MNPKSRAMKLGSLIIFFLLNGLVSAAQNAEIPPAYLRDSLPALVRRCKDLLDHAYMAQTLLATTDSLIFSKTA